MAKLLSHNWSMIRGSVGGITYLSGPHHAIIARTRVAPVQPVSIFKTFAKNALTAASSEWERLSAAEQQDWANYALTVIRSGAVGNYNVTGRLLMMGALQLQTYISVRGLAAPSIVKTAPVLEGMLLPTEIQPVEPLGPAVVGVGISITADVEDDTTCLIDISKPFEKERHFWKGPWDTLKSQAVIIPKNTTVQTDFIGLTVNRYFFFRVKCVSDDVGPRLSSQFFLRGLSVATIP